MADYFKILDVSAHSSDAEVRKKYLKLAQKWHPDVNKEPGAIEHFKKIKAAYEALKDHQGRSRVMAYGAQDYAPPGQYNHPHGYASPWAQYAAQKDAQKASKSAGILLTGIC
jgi:DnaJ-class molecular chaperone